MLPHGPICDRLPVLASAPLALIFATHCPIGAYTNIIQRTATRLYCTEILPVANLSERETTGGQGRVVSRAHISRCVVASDSTAVADPPTRAAQAPISNPLLSHPSRERKWPCLVHSSALIPAASPHVAARVVRRGRPRSRRSLCKGPERGRVFAPRDAPMRSRKESKCKGRCWGGPR